MPGRVRSRSAGTDWISREPSAGSVPAANHDDAGSLEVGFPGVPDVLHQAELVLGRAQVDPVAYHLRHQRDPGLAQIGNERVEMTLGGTLGGLATSEQAQFPLGIEAEGEIGSAGIGVDRMAGSKIERRQERGVGVSIQRPYGAQALDGLCDIQVGLQRLLDQLVQAGIAEGLPPVVQIRGGSA
jgi:hypothetical protein